MSAKVTLKLNIKSLFSLCFIIISLLFVSCYDPIFCNVRKEVEPVSPNVYGSISQITRYKVNSDTYLAVANGELMTKKVTKLTPEASQTSSSLWMNFSLPVNSNKMHYYNTASDENCLYVLAVDYFENESEGENDLDARRLFCYSKDSESATSDGYSWKEITVDGMSKSMSDSVSIFCTNAPMDSHRKAFLNNAGVVYELSNGTAVKIAEKTAVTVDGNTTYTTKYYGSYNDAENNLDYLSYGCCWFDGKVRFYKNKTITTNECSGYGTESEATAIWFADGRSVYLTKSGTGMIINSEKKYENAKLIVSTAPVYSLGATANAILCGTNVGLVRIISADVGPVDDESLDYKTAEFETNGSSMLSSYYDVLSILVLDSSKKEKEVEAYASIDFRGSTTSSSAQFKKIGLYSFYKERGNWNRE